jgi:hypothetical protein
MRHKTIRSLTAALAFAPLCIAPTVGAHHSNSAYQVDEIITLEGTVTEWQWVNPHTWLMMTVEDDAGRTTQWAVEGRAPGVLGRAGWNREILQPGEVVTVHASPSKDGSAVGIIARVTKSDGTILGNRPETAAIIDAEIARQAASQRIAGKPNFAGVYYPFNPNAQAAPAQRGREAAPPPPTRTGPTSDGSQGRRPNQPKLTPEYMAQWEVIAASRTSGSYEYDNIANCLPPGMPSMMSAAYGMEVMQNEDKITFFGEHQDALRRVYLDGRQPSEAVLNDPTYAGYSTGHWEGDTLVVDTVAITTKSYIDSDSPHSDQMTVHERIRLIAPDVLEDQITVNDPIALEEPWQITRTYRKAAYPDDELREFACAEGLRDAPH